MKRDNDINVVKMTNALNEQMLNAHFERHQTDRWPRLINKEIQPVAKIHQHDDVKIPRTAAIYFIP